jgi:hypothetical protein
MSLEYRVVKPTSVISAERMGSYVEWGLARRKGSRNQWADTMLIVDAVRPRVVTLDTTITLVECEPQTRSVKDIRNDLLVALCALEAIR